MDVDPAADHSWLTGPPPPLDDVRRRYDDWVDTYDDMLASWRYGAPAVVAEHVARAIAPSGTVLDAGCGTGLVGVALRRAGHRGPIIGIDVSEPSVRRAVAATADTFGAVSDLNRPLPIADRSVNAVTCVGVLTYVPDVASIWSEFCRVTRPGGIIAMTQRSDVWHERSCDDVATALADDARWQIRWLSGDEPYMPANPDFADRIGVRYLVASVGRPDAG